MNLVANQPSKRNINLNNKIKMKNSSVVASVK